MFDFSSRRAGERRDTFEVEAASGGTNEELLARSQQVKEMEEELVALQQSHEVSSGMLETKMLA